MKKRAKVHPLPTNKESRIGIRTNFDTPLTKVGEMAYLPFEHDKDKDWEYKHLYITTDDEIKEGDWVYDAYIKQPVQLTEELFKIKHTKMYSKIIATTDFESTLPQPSKEFIEEYCRVGGIDEVDVEYGLFHDGNFKDDDETHAFKATRKPRVNSHNEIIIHPVKDSWTMEDLPDLLSRFCKDHSLHRGLQITDGMIREWLEKQ